MNEKQFEECSFEEATHVEMGGKLYELGYGYTREQDVIKYNNHRIEVRRTTAGFQLIHVDMFPILGIKPLRENKKREPMVFTYIFNNGIAPPNEAYGKTFLCVELVEEKK